MCARLYDCTVLCLCGKGVSSVDPTDSDGAKYHVHQRTSWGVCTELSFQGFVHFLRLCEARAPLPPGTVQCSNAVPYSNVLRLQRNVSQIHVEILVGVENTCVSSI